MSFFRPGEFQRVVAPGAIREIAYESETLFLTIDLEPGYKAPAHNHTWATLYYITSGEGRVLVGEEWRDVGPGTLAMTPPNTMHAIEATTRLTLVEVQSNCERWFVDLVLSGKSLSTPGS
ncbi:MAG: cupin domain-containing protein [Chloroflexi bacterium]|nr:cupin domain-containing protein [Chloroflexota bacterium]